MSAGLVVEVADTSLEYDRSTKGSLYAEVGLEDYWIVNLIDRQLEVHREPQKGPNQAGDHAYGNVVVLSPSDTISPVVLPEASIKVSDLLP